MLAFSGGKVAHAGSSDMRFPWSSAPDLPKVTECGMPPPTAPMTESRRRSSVVEASATGRPKRLQPHDKDLPSKPVVKRSRKGSASTAQSAPSYRQLKLSGGRKTSDSSMATSGWKGTTLSTESDDAERDHDPQDMPREVEAHAAESLSSRTAPKSPSMKQLAQTIQSQFGLEILLKHQELRLIDQELAKCRTAYEQLRRCTLVQFTDEGRCRSDPAQIFNAPPANWRTASSILNGPYSKHYARWLIPDSRFDGDTAASANLPENVRQGKRPLEGRATRATVGETGSMSGKGRSRGVAGSINAFVPSSAHNKERAGPLVLKRSSDGQMVKLVCLDCDRGDFSSAQGFINHCRIAHHRGFESHDAAANACGQIVEFDQTGQLIDEEAPGFAGTVALVHPLIRLAPTTRSLPMKPARLTGNGTSAGPSETPRRSTSGPPALRITPAMKFSAAFASSRQTPHLSALMQARGHGGDLEKMVVEAKMKCDLSGGTSSEEEDEDEEDVGIAETLQDTTDRSRTGAHSSISGGSRITVPGHNAAASASHSQHSKSVDRSGNGHGPFSRSYPSQSDCPSVPNDEPRMRTQRSHIQDVTVPSEAFSPPTLSPSTMDATTAPSLVSDDGDYEAHSESEAFDSEEADTVDYGIEFDVEEGEELTGSDATAATDPELGDSSTSTPKTPMPRRTALRRGTSALNQRSSGREQRHVSFVSPTREVDIKGRGSRRNARK